MSCSRLIRSTLPNVSTLAGTASTSGNTLKLSGSVRLLVYMGLVEYIRPSLSIAPVMAVAVLGAHAALTSSRHMIFGSRRSGILKTTKHLFVISNGMVRRHATDFGYLIAMQRLQTIRKLSTQAIQL